MEKPSEHQDIPNHPLITRIALMVALGTAGALGTVSCASAPAKPPIATILDNPNEGGQTSKQARNKAQALMKLTGYVSNLTHVPPGQVGTVFILHAEPVKPKGGEDYKGWFKVTWKKRAAKNNEAKKPKVEHPPMDAKDKLVLKHLDRVIDLLREPIEAIRDEYKDSMFFPLFATTISTMVKDKSKLYTAIREGYDLDIPNLNESTLEEISEKEAKRMINESLKKSKLIEMTKALKEIPKTHDLLD